MKRSSSKLLAFAALVIAVVALVVAMVGGGPLTAPQEMSSAQTTTAEPGSASMPPSVANPSALPTINASQLPKEAQQTLALIAKGGPYPYDRDGVTFSNFEGLLPKKSGGFYKEYTVPTPGESDRGARRIIVGKDTAKYYTADHYDSFKFIVEGK